MLRRFRRHPYLFFVVVYVIVDAIFDFPDGILQPYDLLENGKNQEMTLARRINWFACRTLGLQEPLANPITLKIFYGNKLVGVSEAIDDDTDVFDLREMKRPMSSRLVAQAGEPIKILVNKRMGTDILRMRLIAGIEEVG